MKVVKLAGREETMCFNNKMKREMKQEKRYSKEGRIGKTMGNWRGWELN